MTERGRRGYQDYEELGRRLEALDEALGGFQQQVIQMWGFGGDALEEARHLAPSVQVLDMVLTLERLHRQLALECAAEIDEAEVPAEKPRFPSPFDRRGLYSG